MRVLGPYVYRTGRSAGRKYVQIIHDDGRKTSKLYSKWMMEQHLGRSLSRKEVVHHINEDKTDDRIENFEILTPAEHAYLHALGRPSPQKGIERGWKHGTTYAWMKKKCRCPICFPLWREWQDSRNLKRLSTSPRGPYRRRGEPEHGTEAMYRKGCRLLCCKAAHTERQQKYRATTRAAGETR